MHTNGLRFGAVLVMSIGVRSSGFRGATNGLARRSLFRGRRLAMNEWFGAIVLGGAGGERNQGRCGEAEDN